MTTTTCARDSLLLEFLRENDAACPVCDYNLRALTLPRCPECHHDLALTVGTKRLRIGWLVLAIAPGCFSAIAALFVLVPIVGRFMFGDGVLSLALIALDGFGWLSGIFAFLIAIKPKRFLARPRAQQRWFAIIIWLIHITAFALFVLFGARYM